MEDVVNERSREWNLSTVHLPEHFVAEKVYSGEPLPSDPEFPVEYIYSNGESVMCYTSLDLVNAAQYDFQLTLYPSLVTILGVVVAVIAAVYFY